MLFRFNEFLSCPKAPWIPPGRPLGSLGSNRTAHAYVGARFDIIAKQGDPCYYSPALPGMAIFLRQHANCAQGANLADHFNANCVQFAPRAYYSSLYVIKRP